MDYQSGAVSPVGSIENGWRIIKDDYWVFFGMTAVALVITAVVSFVISFINGLIANGIALAFGLAAKNAGDVARVSASVLPQIISLIISIFTNIIVITLSGAFACGIFSGLSRKANTGVAEFGDLFSGFQKIQACLIVAVIRSIIGFVLGIVFLLGGTALGVGAVGAGMLITSDGKFNPALLGGVLIGVFILLVIYAIISLVIGVISTFIYPLIGERNLSGGEAFMLSVKSGLGNLVGLFLLLILCGLMMVGGFFACIVGMLFVLPIVSASVFAAYQSVFGPMRGGSFNNPPPPPAFR
jgi:hypothetical protein